MLGRRRVTDYPFTIHRPGSGVQEGMAEEIVKRETMGLETLPMAEDVVVLARDPEEMANAQQGLIAWMDGKLTSLRTELSETEENLATAKRLKHRTDGWKRQVLTARKRVTYYEKARMALEAGYCIVPDFPVQVIAVRTTRDNPPGRYVEGGGHRVPDIKCEQLPAGEGDYVGPQPYTSTSQRKTDDGRTQSQSYAIALREVDFPFKIVKPQILKGLEEALKQRLFDEIGILPSHRRNVDPILVGRIKRREGYNESTMTFLIAWWIDTRSL
jgi:hypothetical protein